MNAGDRLTLAPASSMNFSIQKYDFFRKTYTVGASKKLFIGFTDALALATFF